MKIGFPPALTQLSEEEQMLQTTVLDFARERVAPLVHEMDGAQLMNQGIIAKLFELGLMGIEIRKSTVGSEARSSNPSLRSRLSHRSTLPSG